MRVKYARHHRRLARQDDDDLARRDRPARRRARPDRRRRRQGQRARHRTRASARAISSSPRPTRATARSCKLTPTIAVVTNIDAEHLDHYGTHDEREGRVRRSSPTASRSTASCVLCIDHPHVQEILPRIERRHVTYGVSRAGRLPREEHPLRGPRDALRRLPARASRSATFVVQHAGRAQRPQRARGHRRRRRARGPARRHARGDRAASTACSGASRSSGSPLVREERQDAAT